MINASTIIELVGALSFIGIDDKRATHWATYKNKKQSYPTARDGINSILSTLEIIDPSAIDNWHNAYTFLCMAKHVNPLLAINYSLRPMGNDEFAHIRGPDTSKIGIFFSAETLYMVIKVSMAGIIVASQHCTKVIIKNKLHSDANDIGSRLSTLEEWYNKEIAIDRSTLNSKVDEQNCDN
jgi:hypothetical protein